MQRNDTGNNLVKLELVGIMDMDPMPDKAMQGRLTRMLKQVGSQDTITIRARMITTVSNTKFKTKDGHPISLVGLYGKDELLVRGPDWAIEEIGRGRTPEIGKHICQLRDRKSELTDLLNLIDDSDRPEVPRHGYGIEDVLLDADKLDALAKSELKQRIKKFLAELSELLELAESGSIPWWYFWSNYWTEREEYFCLEEGNRIIPETILPRGHGIKDIDIRTMNFATFSAGRKPNTP